MNPFIFSLAIIFLPGIVTTSILQFFNTLNKKYTQMIFFLYSFLNGVITYFIIFSFRKKNLFLTLNSFVSEKTSKDSTNLTPFITDDFDFLLSLIIAFVLGLFLSFIRNRGSLHQIASKFGITYETGFNSALEYIYKNNSIYTNSLKESFVNIKLLDGSALYQGTLMVQEFHPEFTEILLNDVTIIFPNNLGENIKYEQSDIYLQLKPGTFVIEWYESNLSEEKFSFRFIKAFFSLIIFIVILFFIIYFLIKLL